MPFDIGITFVSEKLLTYCFSKFSKSGNTAHDSLSLSFATDLWHHFALTSHALVCLFALALHIRIIFQKSQKIGNTAQISLRFRSATDLKQAFALTWDTLLHKN